MNEHRERNWQTSVKKKRPISEEDFAPISKNMAQKENYSESLVNFKAS